MIRRSLPLLLAGILTPLPVFFMIEPVKPGKESPPAQTAPQPLARSTADVAITPRQITIAHHAIPLPASRQQLVSALGAPTRVKEFPHGTNRILIWDPLGLVAYQSYATGKIFELCFYFQSKPKLDFSPRTLSGPMTIGAAKIDASSTLDAIGHEILRQGGKDVVRMDFGTWTLNYGRFAISLEEIDSATIQAVAFDPQRTGGRPALDDRRSPELTLKRIVSRLKR